MKTYKGSMLVAVLGLLAMAACGGVKVEATSAEDGGGTAPAVSTAKVTLAGQAVKGPLHAATVTLYTLNSDGTLGASLATTTTDDTGHWTTQGNFAGPVAIVVTGGSYTDEATGNPVDNKPEDQLITWLDQVKDAMSIASTPLTTIAVQRANKHASQGLATAIANANKEVADLFKLSGIDITQSEVDDLTGPAAKDPARKNAAQYGLALAALTQVARDKGIAPGQVMQMIRDFAEDFSDGTLDGKDGEHALETFPSLNPAEALQALDTAEANFLHGERNHSEWTEESMETINATSSTSTTIDTSNHTTTEGHTSTDSNTHTIGGEPGATTMNPMPSP